MKKLLVILCIILGQTWAISAENNIYMPYLPTDKEIIFTQEMFPISSINPTVLSNMAGGIFPGLRGANQLIIYTPEFGYRTNTNEYGTEAIVTGNTVSAVSGADSFIPSNGVVVSGHGKAKKWISENLILGSKIYIDKENKVITAYVTSDSFLFGADEKIKEAQDIMEYYKKNSLVYDAKKTENYIKTAKYFLKRAQKDAKNVQRYSGEAIEAANSAIASAVPYRENELKGVWIRPTEQNEAAIERTIRDIKKAGIDNIFLETYFHGKTIFPSDVMESYGFLKQNEKFIGEDPLKIWIAEAHKNDMKVHIWFESFYIGNDNPKDNPQNIIAVKPSWANINKKNYDSTTPVYSLSEHNGYFIDPANPEVQEFLCKLLDEIITKYAPDGINLDYVRYPQSISARYSGYEASNWGYTAYAREEFKKLYDTDPIDLTANDDQWLVWNKYRQDNVTEFIKRAGELCRDKKTIVTTVIFPDINTAKTTKQQDWRSWSVKNYVDGFTPLFLTCDFTVANSMMKEINKQKSDNTKLYAGLFVTFMGGSQEDLIRLVHEARKMDTSGVIIFDYAHLNDKYIKTLTMSAFDKPCPPPVKIKKFKRRKC